MAGYQEILSWIQNVEEKSTEKGFIGPQAETNWEEEFSYRKGDAGKR